VKRAPETKPAAELLEGNETNLQWMQDPWIERHGTPLSLVRLTRYRFPCKNYQPARPPGGRNDVSS
jgi:hypothetical protein